MAPKRKAAAEVIEVRDDEEEEQEAQEEGAAGGKAAAAAKPKAVKKPKVEKAPAKPKPAAKPLTAAEAASEVAKGASMARNAAIAKLLEGIVQQYHDEQAWIKKESTAECASAQCASAYAQVCSARLHGAARARARACSTRVGRRHSRSALAPLARRLLAPSDAPFPPTRRCRAQAAASKAVKAVKALVTPIQVARQLLAVEGCGKGTVEKVEAFLKANPNASAGQVAQQEADDDAYLKVRVRMRARARAEALPHTTLSRPLSQDLEKEIVIGMVRRSRSQLRERANSRSSLLADQPASATDRTDQERRRNARARAEAARRRCGGGRRVRARGCAWRRWGRSEETCTHISSLLPHVTPRAASAIRARSRGARPRPPQPCASGDPARRSPAAPRRRRPWRRRGAGRWRRAPRGRAG